MNYLQIYIYIIYTYKFCGGCEGRPQNVSCCVHNKKPVLQIDTCGTSLICKPGSVAQLGVRLPVVRKVMGSNLSIVMLLFLFFCTVFCKQLE